MFYLEIKLVKIFEIYYMYFDDFIYFVISCFISLSGTHLSFLLFLLPIIFIPMNEFYGSALDVKWVSSCWKRPTKIRFYFLLQFKPNAIFPVENNTALVPSVENWITDLNLKFLWGRGPSEIWPNLKDQ